MLKLDLANQRLKNKAEKHEVCGSPPLEPPPRTVPPQTIWLPRYNVLFRSLP
jgi:hypothetical protein